MKDPIFIGFDLGAPDGDETVIIGYDPKTSEYWEMKKIPIES